MGAGRIVQWFRVLVAFAENQFDFPHLHSGTHPAETPVLGNLTAYFALNSEPTHDAHTYIHTFM